MKRALLTICLVVFAALAAPAVAQSDAGQRVQEAIIAQLSSQGFTRVRISNTILGRVRIYATRPGTTREIILNPRTGEILRDYWDDSDELENGLVSPSASGSTSTSTSTSTSRSDDGDDADDKEDDRDDDKEDDRDDDRDDEKDDDKDDDSNDDGGDD